MINVVFLFAPNVISTSYFYQITALGSIRLTISLCLYLFSYVGLLFCLLSLLCLYT
uniref:Uncharacterized protein n=1 Tax=Arundo donax TaxID=35708 RepID=A0A0A9S5D6_ARUDO